MRSRKIDSLLFYFISASAVFALGVVAGLVMVRYRGSQDAGVGLREWARMDFILDGARWGFYFGSLESARRVVDVQSESIEACAERVPLYPCKPKLAIRANLMVAALKAESGDPGGAELSIQRAVNACLEGMARPCSIDTARRTVADLVAKRHGG